MERARRLDRLPIDEALPEVLDRLRQGPSLVLEAPPGAGKTTRVPPALLDSGLCGQGDIVVLEPRRLAARLSARRVADERGERPGETVGYQVRFEDVSGPATRLRYVTEGLFARRLLADPELRGVSAVVLDEFHERHLQGDVALACILRLQRTARPDLKLLVMSATLDADPIARHLGCAVVRSAGRRFPVEVEHLEKPDERRLSEQVAAAVRKLTAPGTAGDTLVFLPGAAEIRQAQEACAELAQHRSLLVFPLHGDLPPDEQDRALLPAQKRKVILATNVAETSVTIEGVTAVVDSGLARIAGHSPWTGLPTLRVAKVSRASAEQRAGRAGRTAPGRALRLYTRHDFEARPAQLAPEIERLDLSETLLELRAAGLHPRALPWLDAPPELSLQAAEALLHRLSLVDRSGAIQPLGRAAARFPLHPRLSRLLLEAKARGPGDDGCALAAILAEGDPRTREAMREGGPTGPSDLLELLDLMGEAERARFAPQKLRALGLDAAAARRIDRARAQLLRLLRGAPANARADGASGATVGGAAAREAAEIALRIAVLAAFPDRVARRRAENGAELLLSAGGTAQLAASSAVREAPLLVAVDVEERGDLQAGRFAGPQRGRGALVRLASAIEPEWLLDLFPESLRDSVELVWDEGRERVQAVSKLSYDALSLEETRRPPRMEDGDEARRASALLAAELRSRGAAAMADPEALRELRGRVELVALHAPEAGLRPLTSADEGEALAALCEGRSSLEELRGLDLAGLLLERAGPSAAAALARLAPEQVALPGGRRVRIEYAEGQPPAARSRLQDFFGMARGPSVVAGRVPVVLHLLAPNGRAQQVTQDLAGFWSRHYPAVRKELMRKYPRHAWPEDGARATPPAPRR